MSNLLPPISQDKVRAGLRARFLLAFSLILFCGAALSLLALAPAEVGLVFFSPPTSQSAQSGIDVAQDNAAIAHTKALLASMGTVSATSSLDEVLAALSQQGAGVKINDIAYSISSGKSSLTLEGVAAEPSDVNTFRQNLQSDLRFTNVSVPVSALLGSQNGSFTITMNVVQ